MIPGKLYGYYPNIHRIRIVWKTSAMITEIGFLTPGDVFLYRRSHNPGVWCFEILTATGVIGYISRHSTIEANSGILPFFKFEGDR